MTYRMLLDTCVWLDLAKDARNAPIISALEEISETTGFEIIVPDLVKAEFEQNKGRVIDVAQQSLRSQFKLVRNAVSRLSEDENKEGALAALSEVDRRIKVVSQDVGELVERIETIFSKSATCRIGDALKSRVTDRAMARKAPFHRNKNNAADALLIEMYTDLKAELLEGEKLAFVTHNYRDFSTAAGNRNNPHEDLQPLFDSQDSSYWLSTTSLLNEIDIDLLANHDLEFEGWDESRRLSEIVEAEDFFYQQVWYNRHMNRRVSAERRGETVTIGVEAANEIESKLGAENIGPWDDFEWGMINGKLSALRWVLGDEWDMLDT